MLWCKGCGGSGGEQGRVWCWGRGGEGGAGAGVVMWSRGCGVVEVE